MNTCDHMLPLENRSTLDYKQKRDTPQGCLMLEDVSKALQRRVIRVSETFGESRSSGDARPERSEWSACP